MFAYLNFTVAFELILLVKLFFKYYFGLSRKQESINITGAQLIKVLDDVILP